MLAAVQQQAASTVSDGMQAEISGSSSSGTARSSAGKKHAAVLERSSPSVSGPGQDEVGGHVAGHTRHVGAPAVVCIALQGRAWRQDGRFGSADDGGM